MISLFFTLKYLLQYCSCIANSEKYAFNMELFDKVVKDESKWNTKGRNVILNVSKKDKE